MQNLPLTVIFCPAICFLLFSIRFLSKAMCGVEVAEHAGIIVSKLMFLRHCGSLPVLYKAQTLRPPKPLGWTQFKFGGLCFQTGLQHTETLSDPSQMFQFANTSHVWNCRTAVLSSCSSLNLFSFPPPNLAVSHGSQIKGKQIVKKGFRGV